jgi:hypothetical protein
VTQVGALHYDVTNPERVHRSARVDCDRIDGILIDPVVGKDGVVTPTLEILPFGGIVDVAVSDDLPFRAEIEVVSAIVSTRDLGAVVMYFGILDQNTIGLVSGEETVFVMVKITITDRDVLRAFKVESGGVGSVPGDPIWITASSRVTDLQVLDNDVMDILRQDEDASMYVDSDRVDYGPFAIFDHTSNDDWILGSTTALDGDSIILEIVVAGGNFDDVTWQSPLFNEYLQMSEIPDPVCLGTKVFD